MRTIILTCSIALVASATLSPPARAEVVELQASRDGTLYEDPTGALSNGSGTRMFSGRTGQNLSRRGLVAFDVAGSIPVGARVTEVSLTLVAATSNAEDQTVRLHRLAADWGEGGSSATGGQGAGAPAEAGDATWIHTFYDTVFWTSPGGDFSSSVSAESIVRDPGRYTWSTDAMVADVQAWVDAPDSAFGWVLIGNETEPGTAKVFSTREVPDPTVHPLLIVRFDSTAGVPATSRSGVLLMALILLLCATLLLRKRKLLS